MKTEVLKAIEPGRPTRLSQADRGPKKRRGAPASAVRSIASTTLSPFVQQPYARQAWNLTGEIVDDLLREGERFFDDLIARGASFDEVVSQLDSLFGKWIEGGLVEPTPAGNIIPLRASSRLETIARTEYAKAYNTGRLALITDPTVRNIVVGVQYSSILDSRTTEYCRRWDGVVIGIENVDALARYMPPAHFNCRATPLPVTIYDNVKVTPIEQWPRDARGKILEPMPGFGGTRRKAA